MKIVVTFLSLHIIFYHNGQVHPAPLPKTQVLLEVKEMKELDRCVKGKDKEDVELVRMYKELDLMDKEKAMNILDKEMDMIKIYLSHSSKVTRLGKKMGRNSTKWILWTMRRNWWPRI